MQSSCLHNLKVSLADSQKLPLKCETLKHLRLPPTSLTKVSSIYINVIVKFYLNDIINSSRRIIISFTLR